MYVLFYLLLVNVVFVEKMYIYKRHDQYFLILATRIIARTFIHTLATVTSISLIKIYYIFTTYQILVNMVQKERLNNCISYRSVLFVTKTYKTCKKLKIFWNAQDYFLCAFVKA